MRIIFLDDDHNRWHEFKQAMPQAVHAETAEQCIQMIKNSQNIDWLFLDHDLGGEAYVNSNRKDCGMEVVRFLCDAKLTNLDKIIVHSHNKGAAIEMEKKLYAAGYNVRMIPFYNLIDALKGLDKVMSDED